MQAGRTPKLYIVCLYNRQRNLVLDLLRDRRGWARLKPWDVAVLSADACQGSEADLVLVSTVRNVAAASTSGAALSKCVGQGLGLLFLCSSDTRRLVPTAHRAPHGASQLLDAACPLTSAPKSQVLQRCPPHQCGAVACAPPQHPGRQFSHDAAGSAARAVLGQHPAPLPRGVSGHLPADVSAAADLCFPGMFETIPPAQSLLETPLSGDCGLLCSS